MIQKPVESYDKLMNLLNLVELSCEEVNSSSILEAVVSLQKKYECAFTIASELQKRHVPDTLTQFSKIMYEASEMYSILIRPPIDLRLLRRLQEAHEEMDRNFQDWIEGMLTLWID